ncbi:MAG: hypothetical protein ACI87W_002688 [Halieaceae bacterium]|jgi:hypothetical protein
MNNAFKPLGLAAAVAAASVGVNAQTVNSSEVGDLALVPYYTVNGDWVTGVHIVNTSAKTQVVKFRFRRASDSLDALDFSIVMSPKDVYAGFLNDADGTIKWSADVDTTCTVPVATSGALEMPSIYNPNGESATGYIEIIAMGAPTSETMPIALGAKHKDGTPLDCAAVRSNFFANGVVGTARGVVDNATSYQVGPTTKGSEALTGTNEYEDSGDVLKVSYFIRDNATGIEFGDNAVHIAGFLTQPAVTNQEFGWLSGDLDGFDFPDLDGGPPTATTPERGRFDALRGVLGTANLSNEWSTNPANGVAVDWVVTLPGQYTMMDTPEYVVDELDDNDASKCVRDVCDYRDIPVTATISIWDREEAVPAQDAPIPGDLVVSPNIPGTPDAPVVTQLTQEVNVVTFGGGSVLGVSDVTISDPGVAAPFGWMSLSVTSATGTQSVCDWDATEDTAGGPRVTDAKLRALMGNTCTPVTNSGVPMIGFAAWARSVAANPDASYGRIIEHSFTS